ncbi:hypothetical protein SDRG_12498 [Saprolegnia diclina VS20]|uniref:Ankyrin repeat domain-containing protein n=1 Tax=Saprolegnia diclina (strain VS20) TaxID=1156394 RepID=T0Q534_SAPDV|nr:hypothetical protein SDRG_12498 [Saprolegnia diclina VS20]EQC29726.1 hypothetical protein SDRG_12498 [Saprolegnia diclina VS20]|eukprot:XP_008616792.1 hypothetical protein SDRG_12498 [Saprolegnia diclina VS20]
MAASTVLRSSDLFAAITAHQDGLTEAMADVQMLADAVHLTLPSIGRLRHLVNVPAAIAALPYLQRYPDPTTKLSAHALFVSPTVADPALALHLSIVQGHMAIVRQWLRHDATLVTSATLELAAASSQGAILRLLFARYPELATPKMMDLVAMAGDLALLRWLHEAGAICTTAAMDGAAMNGHLDVVVFLHETRAEGCTVAAVTAAAANGHADIVRYLFNHRTERVDAWLYYDAPHSDHKTHRVEGTTYLEAIDLIMTTTTTLHENVLLTSIERLGLPALQHIYASGYQRITPQCLEVALLRQDHSMLSFALHALFEAHASGIGEWQPPDEDENAVENNLRFGFPTRWRDYAFLDTAAFCGNLAAIQLLHASRLRGATERAMANAACNGHLEALQWLHAHRQDGCSADAMALAAARGHSDVVYWLLNVYQLPLTNAVLASAAANGNLPLVQYLLSWLPGASDDVGDATVLQLRVPSQDRFKLNMAEYFDGRPTDWAVRRGHLQVLQCLVAYGCVVSPVAINDAVQHGHLDVMVYLHGVFDQRCSTFDALSKAVCHHSISVLTHALLHHTIWAATDDVDERALDVHILCVYVARRGDVAILDLVAKTFALDCLRDLPRRVQERMLVRAAAHGHLEMLQYLVETHGFAWTSAVESAARNDGRKRVLRYLATLGPAVPSAYALGDVALAREIFDRSRRRVMVDGHPRVQPM